MLPNEVTVGLGERSGHLSDELLSETERKDYGSFTNRRRREEYLSTRSLIGELLDSIGLDRSIFEIHKDGFGKPFGIYNNSRYNLSLAHSDEKVICGISPDVPIGIDLEPVGRKVSERLRERMLHAEERDHFRKESPVRIWTLKEAMVKLEGKGLRTNLNRIIIKPEDEFEFKGIFDDDKTARICSFTHGGYWIAVAHYL